MRPFTVHTGRAVPLRRANIDTDQIIPSDYLKSVRRTGFAEGLFWEWRLAGDCVLDRPEYVGASILLAGPDFGTGSSREHAVWALQDGGFRVVVSSRFADIFRNNALGGGLLAVTLEADHVETLMALTEQEPATGMTVDLHAKEVRCPTGTFGFTIEDSARRRLLEGLDDIDLTLAYESRIAEFERRRPPWKPVTGLAGQPMDSGTGLVG